MVRAQLDRWRPTRQYKHGPARAEIVRAALVRRAGWPYLGRTAGRPPSPRARRSGGAHGWDGGWPCGWRGRAQLAQERLGGRLADGNAALGHGLDQLGGVRVAASARSSRMAEATMYGAWRRRGRWSSSPLAAATAWRKASAVGRPPAGAAPPPSARPGAPRGRGGGPERGVGAAGPAHGLDLDAAQGRAHGRLLGRLGLDLEPGGAQGGGPPQDHHQQLDPEHQGGRRDQGDAPGGPGRLGVGDVEHEADPGGRGQQELGPPPPTRRGAPWWW